MKGSYIYIFLKLSLCFHIWKQRESFRKSCLKRGMVPNEVYIYTYVIIHGNVKGKFQKKLS